jgi:hypothetical protein
MVGDAGRRLASVEEARTLLGLRNRVAAA